jgi:alkylation response protein AidB-like acyl-CoA dehydrogenase
LFFRCCWAKLNLNFQGASIAGQLALLKVHSTQAFEFCAREASQIFGGASYLRSGPGEVIERLYREVRVRKSNQNPKAKTKNKTNKRIFFFFFF